MSSSTTRTVLGIVIALGVAAGAVAISNDRYADADGSLAQACAGAPATPQLENALFNARARSNDGYDPVCAGVVNDGTADGQLLSQSRSPGRNAEESNDIGSELRRR
jgi:hypothetical protein